MQRFTLAATTADDLNQFMENQGRLWGARRDAVQRAEQAAWQAFDLLAHSKRIAPELPELNVTTRFDEYALRVRFSYQGQALPVPRDTADRKSVVLGKSVSVRVDLGGRRLIKKKKKKQQVNKQQNN